MKVGNNLIVLALIATIFFLQPIPLSANTSSVNQLVLEKGSKEMVFNGQQLFAAQPVTTINGSAYVALNGISVPYEYRLVYDSLTKESIAIKGSNELRFKAGSAMIKSNGREIRGPGPAYNLNGSLMIPIRMWSELTASKVISRGSEIIMSWPNDTFMDRSSETTLLRVSSNGRYLIQADGKPFFWMADTAWELIHRLNREEVLTYLTNAADEGFNVIQVVGLAQLDGLTVGNAQGDLPLHDRNPSKPAVTEGNNPLVAKEYDYWDHADYVIDTASSLGIYVAFLPSWGEFLWNNKGQSADVIFNESNSTDYGQWLGKRYKNKQNIIWVLGGDRIPDSPDKLTIVRNMAGGIESEGANQLMTYHPWGQESSSKWFHHDEWLDFNMVQSGHPWKDYPNYDFIVKDYALMPIKPTLDSEPRYEHGPINFKPSNGYFNAYDARQAAYWSVFAGGFGHTYGHNSLWQIYKPGKKAEVGATIYWQDALKATGRMQMKFLRNLMEARPMINRVPDQSLVQNTLFSGEHIRATRGDNYAMIYSARGTEFTVNMGKIAGKTIIAHWYSPATGVSTWVGEFNNSGTQAFTPPAQGNEEDWVLILDDKSANFNLPGGK